MLCAKLLKVPPSHGRMYQLLERGFDGLATGYARVLRRSLHHPLTVVVGMLALVVGAALVFQTLKREFIPADDRGVININIVGPEGATLQYTDGYQKQVEAILAKVPEVNSVFSVIGRGGSPNGGFVVARLKYWEDRERGIEEIIAELRPKFAAIAGVQIFASNPSAIGGFGSPVQFIVRHPDYDSLLVANERLIAAARKIPGLVNVDTDLKNNKPELTIAYDRDRADDLGVPIGDVATTLQSMLGGTRVSTFTRDSRIYDVFLQLDAAHRATPQDMDQLFVRGRNGQLVRVDATRVDRGDHRPARDRPLRSGARLHPLRLARADAGARRGDRFAHRDRRRHSCRPTTTIALGGDARELSESGNELLLAFGLAILVVFMVLASQFESVVHPFTVLMAVPLAVIGAIFTLKLAGATINLYSQIGMILLVGLVTKNSILLVDYANQLRAKGMEVVEAMLEAGRIRLRPILMTSVATIMGAIPIALGSGAGATSRRPLGYAIVGGHRLLDRADALRGAGRLDAGRAGAGASTRRPGSDGRVRDGGDAMIAALHLLGHADDGAGRHPAGGHAARRAAGSGASRSAVGAVGRTGRQRRVGAKGGAAGVRAADDQRHGRLLRAFDAAVQHRHRPRGERHGPRLDRRAVRAVHRWAQALRRAAGKCRPRDGAGRRARATLRDGAQRGA